MVVSSEARPKPLREVRCGAEAGKAGAVEVESVFMEEMEINGVYVYDCICMYVSFKMYFCVCGIIKI